MSIRVITATLLAAAIFYNVDARRSKHIKLNSEFEESSPQPSVLTYSTFGFNDVGSYNVPTAPDYSSFLNGNKQEQQTRLYAPAFPTANEGTGFGGNYGSSNGETFQNNGEQETSMSKYPQVSLNFYSPANIHNSNDESLSKTETENFNEYSDNNSPTYGTKLNSKQRNKQYSNYNSSDFQINFKDDSSFLNSNSYSANIPQNQHVIEVKEPFVETDNYPSYYKYAKYATTTTITPPEYEHMLQASPVTASAIKYPKVVDFTKVRHNNNPINEENNRLKSMINDFINSSPSQENDQHTNSFNHNQAGTPYEKDGESHNTVKYKNNFKAEKEPEKYLPKFNYISNLEFSKNYLNNKNKLKDIKLMSESEKTKKPWTYNDQNDESKNEQKYFHSYQYVNNNTNNNGVSFRRPPYNNSIEDAAPASSNLNLLNYQYPEMNYENVRNLFPLIKPFHTESDVSLSIPDKYKSINEYQKNIQNYFTTATPIVTTNWGNLFKENELGSYKKHIRKPNYFEDNTDVVHIPKKQTYKYENNYDGSAYDWSQYYNNYKPHANLYKYTDWAKDISNKYKTDEDLLDLRNHDVTRPSHPPRYRPIDNDATEDFDYKKLVDKWRKSYLKSKQKEALREYETYASEAKPIHVPIHKPYPVSIFYYLS
ncbi:unnamed protein product [Leptidea sinapis]|uniref:Uncharacterized protein n=1 Tax=Leptidea sinapis TaxID=189913 RepID=A0A5E4QHD8_9NEOP|nr:unnamed protein product [Leptidea sinapis]